MMMILGTKTKRWKTNRRIKNAAKLKATMMKESRLEIFGTADMNFFNYKPRS